MYGGGLNMGRPSIQVATLHGYTVDELIDLKNTTESTYTMLALTAITMRYLGYSNPQIIETTGLSKVTIINHVKKWNAFGLKSVEEHRGGKKPPKLSPDIVDDLLYVVLHKTPKDFGFIGYTWTLSLLVSYIKQSYGIEIAGSTIWSTLRANNLSYKRAQPKPTKEVNLLVKL
jgi:transposase